jgi:hypothetical protein
MGDFPMIPDPRPLLGCALLLLLQLLSSSLLAQDAPAVVAPVVEAGAGEAPAVDATDDATDVVTASRTPIQALNEHFLGSASRAVRFDWRRSPVTLGLGVSELVEKNTFGQWRAGVFGRKAFDDVIVEVGVHLYQTYDTLSSQTLALTPFRQAGRPNHLEIDANIGYAVAEGVVTPLTSFIPPAELALVALGGVRYLGYQQTFVDRTPQDIGLALVSPQLSESERDQLDVDALGAMLVDPARLHTMAGLSLDVYFQPGFYVAPRAMVAIPVLVPITASQLGFFWELSLVVGYAL